MGTDTAVAPRVLVLWAHEGSPNLGVAVLARGSRDLLRSILPTAEVSFANYGARPAQVPWGRPRSLVRERVQARFGMQDFFSRFDLIWDTRSGDSFTDIYGLSRHTTMSLVHEFACQAGVPAVLAPQTIGPFHTRRGRALARRTLSRSSLVIARDPTSAQAAEHLGRQADEVTADLVFAIEPPTPAGQRDVLLNVSGLLWGENPHVDSGQYRTLMRELADRLRAAGREVTLLAHVLDSPNPDNDVPAVQELAASLAWTPEVLVPSSLDDARSAMAGSSLIIGSRMHACLNALSIGIPAIPLAYSRKFAPLMESVGWDRVFDLRSMGLSLASDVVRATEAVEPQAAKRAADRGRESLRPVADRVLRLLG